jgi:Peptidase family M48
MVESSRRHLFRLLCLPLFLISFAAPMDAGELRSRPAIQELVNGLKTQLGIEGVVSAEIVTTNTLLVSVQRVEGDAGAFRMSFEERFLNSVDQDELKAIVAHELGHVWIFTHHPYLQTEQLANTVAMRAVPRASLERVYSKVWERQGIKGDLASFLGPE